jgi:hypothetical protein
MIISHRHKFLFSHNPKVAGTSVRKSLSHLHDSPIKNWHQNWEPVLDRVVDSAHIQIPDLRRLIDLEEFHVFTLVRDPYERFFSSVSEHCRQHQVVIQDAPSLNAWIRMKLDEVRLRFDWKYIHFCPQHYFVDWHAGSRFKIESPDDMAAFRSMLEFHTGFHLEEFEVARQANFKFTMRDLDRRSLACINNLYALDFDMLGYPRIDSWFKLEHHHADRVTAIHSPYRKYPDPATLTPGEKIAYDQSVAGPRFKLGPSH